jgi:hypothetical protein
LAKEIAAENDILLEFPASPGEVHQDGRTTSRINSQRASEQTKNAPGRAFVVESAVKTDRLEVCAVIALQGSSEIQYPCGISF